MEWREAPEKCGICKYAKRRRVAISILCTKTSFFSNTRSGVKQCSSIGRQEAGVRYAFAATRRTPSPQLPLKGLHGLEMTNGQKWQRLNRVGLAILLLGFASINGQHVFPEPPGRTLHFLPAASSSSGDMNLRRVQLG